MSIRVCVIVRATRFLPEKVDRYKFFEQTRRRDNSPLWLEGMPLALLHSLFCFLLESAVSRSITYEISKHCPCCPVGVATARAVPCFSTSWSSRYSQNHFKRTHTRSLSLSLILGTNWTAETGVSLSNSFVQIRRTLRWISRLEKFSSNNYRENKNKKLREFEENSSSFSWARF